MSTSVEFGGKASTECYDGLIDVVVARSFAKDGDEAEQGHSVIGSTVHMTYLGQVKVSIAL